jgi:hypothetical protein
MNSATNKATDGTLKTEVVITKAECRDAMARLYTAGWR